MPERWTVPRTRSWGLLLALCTACISGVAVYVNSYLVVQSDDATVYTTAKNGVAAVILMAVLVLARRRNNGALLDTQTVPAKTRRGLLLLGLIGGSVPFVLFFEGLARAASPATGGFIHKTLVVWVALLAVPLLRERLSLLHVAGIALLMAAQVAIADLAGPGLGSGELMILGATLLWAVEFVLAKRLLGTLPSLLVGTARLGFGVVLLAAFVLVTGRTGQLLALTAEQWWWVVVTGTILAGFVTTWYAALARAQAVDVTAVLVLGQVVTMALAAGFEGIPIAPQAWGLGLITAGVAAVYVAAQRVPETVPST